MNHLKLSTFDSVRAIREIVEKYGIEKVVASHSENISVFFDFRDDPDYVTTLLLFSARNFANVFKN